MDNEKLENKLDKIVDHISSIDITLAKQQVTLDDHIRRTEILEDALKPIQRQYWVRSGIVALIGLLAAILSGLAGIPIVLQLLHKL